jgi:hypothetical protein
MRWRAPIGGLLWPASAAIVLACAMPILGSIDKRAARIDAAAAAVRPAVLMDPAAAANAARTGSRALPAVVAAVKAAERGAPLPSPLTPSVNNLRVDFYEFRDGCDAHQGETSSNVCRLGDTDAAKVIVVIGDSHAQMWMPTILRMARRDGWVVVPLVKDRCIPGSWLHPSWTCGAWYGWAIRRARALHPQVTLVAGSWAANADTQAAVRGVASAISAMRKSSASVIVVGDSPHQSRDPADCLLAPHARMKTCATKAPGAELRADMAIASTARNHRAGFVDVRGWFCARAAVSRIEYLCPLVINRTITWIDRGHISQTYGLELAGSFRAAFRRELFR